MDLEAYRLKHDLTYQELATVIGVKQAKQARSYAIGQSWPRPHQLDKILASARGVSLVAMHKRRVDFLPIAQPEAA